MFNLLPELHWSFLEQSFHLHSSNIHVTSHKDLNGYSDIIQDGNSGFYLFLLNWIAKGPMACIALLETVMSM